LILEEPFFKTWNIFPFTKGTASLLLALWYKILWILEFI